MTDITKKIGIVATIGIVIACLSSCSNPASPTNSSHETDSTHLEERLMLMTGKKMELTK